MGYEQIAAVESTEAPASQQPRERLVPDQSLQLPASKLAPVQGILKPRPEPHHTSACATAAASLKFELDTERVRASGGDRVFCEDADHDSPMLPPSAAK